MQLDCPNCKREIDEEMHFCPYCGESVDSEYKEAILFEEREKNRIEAEQEEQEENFLDAVSENDENKIRDMVRRGASSKNSIINATKDGNIKMVELLIDEGLDLDVTDRNGWTALMYAAKNGYVPIVELLIEGGADTSIRINEDYKDHLAECVRMVKCVWANESSRAERQRHYSKHHEGKIHIKPEDGWTALTIADNEYWREHGKEHRQIISMLKKAGTKMTAEQRAYRILLVIIAMPIVAGWILVQFPEARASFIEFLDSKFAK